MIIVSILLRGLQNNLDYRKKSFLRVLPHAVAIKVIHLDDTVKF